MTGAPSPSDVVWTSYGTIIILSERVVDLMQANGFTGWTTYPVSVHTKSGEVVPGYRGLAVTGRCGPIDDSRCRKVPRKYPARTVEQAVGLYFDEASWDGSDLFCASDGTGFVFCTAAVKRALERAKVRNLRLSCVEDIDNYGPPEHRTTPRTGPVTPCGGGARPTIALVRRGDSPDGSSD